MEHAMRIEIDFDEQGRPRRIASSGPQPAESDAGTDVGTDAGEPRLAAHAAAQGVSAAAPGEPAAADDAGPPAVAMDHPLAPPSAVAAEADISATLDGGAAPQLG